MVAATLTPLDELHLRARSISRVRARDPWAISRRPSQTPPDGPWRWWLLMAGRGFGKTRVGAEWARERIQRGCRRFALVGPTLPDVRDVMVEGESGLLACAARYGMRAEYVVSKRRVEFANGAYAFLYSADEPDRLRGPQHEAAWGDEIGAWRYGPDAFANLDMGLRLGPNPQGVMTSTPRVVTLVRDLVKRAMAGDPDVTITRGSTWENRDNLPDSTLRSLESRYAGTRLGRQELEGELLEDVEGALWTLAQIDATRLDAVPDGVSLDVVVVGVDPAATSNEGSAETGIVVVARGSDGHGYVLADRSLHGTPHQWGSAAVLAYDEWQADHITPETNNGGEMVVSTIRTVRDTVPVNPVHASRGKAIRAEPVSALYEQGKMHHVGAFPTLEDQLVTWVPGMTSPDRLDALVWGATDAVLGIPEPESESIARGFDYAGALR